MARNVYPILMHRSIENSLCNEMIIRHGQVRLIMIDEMPLLCSSVNTPVLARMNPGMIMMNSLIRDSIIS